MLIVLYATSCGIIVITANIILGNVFSIYFIMRTSGSGWRRLVAIACNVLVRQLFVRVTSGLPSPS